MKKIFTYIAMAVVALTTLASCNGDYAQPPIVIPEGGLGSGSWDDPMTANQVLEGQTGTDVWMTGYIVGWVNTNISNAYTAETATFSTPCSVASNILIAMSPDETDYEKCVPVQLVSGSEVRKALNLVDNPGNLKKMVCIKGNAERYFGTNGFKSPSNYNWGDKGVEEVLPDIPDIPTGDQTYKKVTAISDGTYMFVVEGSKAAKNLSGNDRWLYVENVKVSNDEIVNSNTALTFTITSTTGGYTIQQANGKYLYLAGTHDSFNAGDAAGTASVWSITPEADGTMSITNVEMGKTVQYSASYESFGAYSDTRGDKPVLYQLQK